jgi:cyclophilin family peptidyl-prolyl cis-trans isomerase
MKRFILGLMIIPLTFLLSECGENGEDTENEKQMKSGQQSGAASSERPLAAIAPESRADYYSSPPEVVIDESKRYLATIQTSKGNIVVELDAVSAPIHTNNFVFLARQGFYDGLTFHRVVPKFVIQGGDPLGTGTGGPGYRIPAEIGLPHHQGVIAMARQGDAVNPDRMSSGSQFYITLEAQPYLDQTGYSVFGKVVQGFDVVQKIQVGDVIERIDIEEK